MKQILSMVLVGLGLVSTANASDVEILSLIFSSEEVKAELNGKDIEAIEFRKQNYATTWTYNIEIKSKEDGMGPNGPGTHPCFTEIEVVSIGGVAGPVNFEPTVSTICAMNMPAPQL